MTLFCNWSQMNKLQIDCKTFVIITNNEMLLNEQKSAWYFKRAGGNFFLKINKHADQNKAVQGDFLLKINKHACTSIRYTRVYPGWHLWKNSFTVKRENPLTFPVFTYLPSFVNIVCECPLIEITFVGSLRFDPSSVWI